MPFGAVSFDKLDTTLKKIEYTMQIGKDKRLSNAASFPSEGFRRVLQQSQISNSACIVFH